MASSIKLLMFSDSDHAGNNDASSNSGMVSFLNGNYFHGYSSGQKYQTVNTAESEYIAMVKALQFGIWAMLFLRELHFRLMYPIPLLGDNQAAILISPSRPPTPTCTPSSPGTSTSSTTTSARSYHSETSSWLQHNFELCKFR